ncbi:MAG: non-hydrolyzing UDP-N-acetylglucosamine 2-epimerase [Candidatus Doudnabacteria bacterium]
MKIISIIGARPNFVKHAPVSREIRREFGEKVIHTGQHYDYAMNKVFFDELSIPEPDYHLEVGSGTHGFQTGEMLKKIEAILVEEHPDMVLVYGDTNTTLAGALAGVKLHLPVAHVESGLRSFDRRMPEEINRVLTDHCADVLFCPTQASVDHLRREGIEKDVYLTGDVMVDAINDHLQLARSRSRVLEDLSLSPKQYMLATLHRAENTDDPRKLSNIVKAFCRIENLVFPCHPRTEKYLKLYGLWDMLNERVRVAKPVGYLDMLMLEINASRILTDSGGVQKEAYILGIPCVTMRDNTEWVETLADGWNVLVGSSTDLILEQLSAPRPRTKQKNLYGDGTASLRIKDVLVNFARNLPLAEGV